MYLHPDLNTWLIMNWEETSFTGRSRDSSATSIRRMVNRSRRPEINLKRIAARMEKLGFSALNIGFEPEFYLFKTKENGEPILGFTDQGGYFDLSPIDGAGDCRRARLELEKIGFTVQASLRSGPRTVRDQLPVLQHRRSLRQRPDVQTRRPEHRRRHGLHATFIPKPVAKVAGSGMPQHYSLWDSDGNNAFYDPAIPPVSV